MMMDDSGVLIFLQRPIALLFFVIGILAILLRIRQSLRPAAADHVPAQ